MSEDSATDFVKSTNSNEDVSIKSSTNSIAEDISAIVDSLPESDIDDNEEIWSSTDGSTTISETANNRNVSSIEAAIQAKFEKSMRFCLDENDISNEPLDLRFHISKVEINQNIDYEELEKSSKNKESSRPMEVVASEVEQLNNGHKRNWYKLIYLVLAVVTVAATSTFLLYNGNQHETVSPSYVINNKLDNLTEWTNIQSNTTKTKKIITAIVGDLKALIVDLENLVNQSVADYFDNDQRFGLITGSRPETPNSINFTPSLMDINHWKNLFTLNVYQRIFTYILATTWSQLICENLWTRVFHTQLNMYLVKAVETIEENSSVNEFEFIFKLQDLKVPEMIEEPLPYLLGIESEDHTNAFFSFLMTSVEHIYSYTQYLNHSLTSDERKNFLKQDLTCFIVRKFNVAKNVLFNLKDTSQTLVMIHFISNILAFLSYLYGQNNFLKIRSSNEISMQMVIKEVLLYISNSLCEFEQKYRINELTSSVDESIYHFIKWRLKSLTGKTIHW